MSAITPTKSLVTSIGSLLEQNKAELQKLLPKHLTIDRLFKVALNCIAKTPKLQECSVVSLVTCIKTCVELGLEPGGALGHAYLVPYGKDCTLIIGYRGLIELARRSGQLSQLEAHVVHANDDFEIEFGLDPKLRHVPCLSGDPGQPKAVYCIARLKDGGKHIEVMAWDVVQGIKKRSKASTFGPWVTDEAEMARKTVVRRAAKYLPLSPELADALGADEDVIDGEVVADRQAKLPESTSVTAEVVESKAKAAVRRKLEIPAEQAAQAIEAPAMADNVPPPTDSDAPAPF